MNRRTLLKAGLGLATLALGPVQRAFAAYNPTPYSPEVFQAALDSGEPFLLGFHASWCSTCRTQERAVSALMDANETYAAVKVIAVDWDEHGRSAFAKDLRIPRRSTLVMFSGGKEVGRLIAQTNKDAIEELFKAAV